MGPLPRDWRMRIDAGLRISHSQEAVSKILMSQCEISSGLTVDCLLFNRRSSSNVKSFRLHQ